MKCLITFLFFAWTGMALYAQNCNEITARDADAIQNPNSSTQPKHHTGKYCPSFRTGVRTIANPKSKIVNEVLSLHAF